LNNLIEEQRNYSSEKYIYKYKNLLDLFWDYALPQYQGPTAVNMDVETFAKFVTKLTMEDAEIGEEFQVVWLKYDP
jgi:hypothetical protein